MAGADGSTSLTTSLGSASRIGISLVVLVGLYFALWSHLGGSSAEPLYLVEPHHIVLLFTACNTAFFASTLLMLASVLSDPARGALGVSLHSQRLMLVAVLFRSGFALSGVFADSWLTWIEATLSTLASGALLILIDPMLESLQLGMIPPDRKPVPAAPEAYPSLLLLGGSVAFALLSCRYGVPKEQRSAQWVCFAISIYVQAGAVLPQRAALLRAKRLPALTGHAFFVLAIAGALRLAMWVVLMLEAELHTWLMLGDYLHTAFLADFVVVYLRSIAREGFAAHVQLAQGMAESV
tara:strand:- start:209 stop:1093 length:885 start_codon:yes stop_codon:yes gene_type:complete